MKKKDIDLKNLEFLVIKSRYLIQEQLKSYESANTKGGVLISISALLIPIAISFISNSDTILIIKLLTLVPTALMILALIYLLRVLMPKGLDHGFDFSQFDKQIVESYSDLLLYEIGANRSSYQDNSPIVRKQNGDFKTGIKLIFACAILLFILVTTSLFIKQSDSKEKCLDKMTIENVDINNLKINTMSNKNSNSDSNSNNQNNQNQQSSQESTIIPSVPREERANIDKGGDSEPLIKK